ncbi:hypothetical protein PESP_a1817 [Pseudoalteromonas espejiana DSM 9414]|uniref:Uncharacterized protein n=1 Tax=Pseudoalteromonas espejiana TaxID=28107 RepID=A0A510XZ40_9GAMM|nr:hypothetical protein [Pseudoalteromonas espejiana]ASM49878.1 hypothetical protein PESP_a1817 [Pseudoalteromonas espejiana DSM 9414]GEK56326.1 hypothetical protein PES01_31710 [Pseudoalteromonas espejiana]
MTKEKNLTTSQLLLKHVLLWTVFGYCYQSAISLLIKMAADAQPDAVLITAFIYGIGFNILTAHLITKYDTHWPIIGSAFIGFVGLVAVPFILFGSAGLIASPLLVGFLFSLPLCSYVVGKIKLKHSKN